MTGPITVINIDDNDAHRYAKSRILAAAGFRVLEASTGEAGLQLVFGEDPQLVLCDLNLPDIDGREICRRIRATESGYLPVVHISATHLTEEVRAESLDSGADVFLAEPVEPRELITVVRTLARLRRTEAALARSEARMRLVTEGAGIGTWEIDLRSGAAAWNRQFRVMLGYPPDEVPASWELWKQRIDPADLPAVSAAMEKAQRESALFSHEHRIRRASDGEERWLAPYGRAHPDERGDITRFMGIAIDVTARKRLEAQREEVLRLEQEARARAEEAARLQDEFLATLSHELRSPMSAVLGWLYLLRSGRLSDEQRADALDVIERNARLQNQLINDLLDVSRIITGQLQLERRPLAAEEVAQAALNGIKPLADEKNIQLATRFGRVDPVIADPLRLQQVFSNLLTNAVKFTPAGGRVECSIEPAGEYVRIDVSDTGEGISADMLVSVFQRFRQADGSRTRRHGGLGLGLAIVRHLVELHGGQVWASSPGLGKGATFSVLLPSVSEHTERAKAALEGRAGGRPWGDGTLPLSGVRALVVDDDPSSLELLERLLCGEGAIVRAASGAAEACAIFSGWRPDVLLLDIAMPERDGYDLLRELRQRFGPEALSVPAVAVSAYARPEDRKQAMRAGFQDYFSKPYDAHGIVRVVAELAKRRTRAPH
jgi:PAS domain S-box-containing protein